MSFQKPRGTFDLIAEEAFNFRFLENFLRKWSKIYGFQEIITPIFENLEIFQRAVGDSSEIVHKEMYKFQDQSQRWLALRPEGTASTIRSIVENKLYLNQNLKLFYFGPMFRYERPQKGRFRQFHQFGIEAIIEKNAFNDAEIISFANLLLKKLNIDDFQLIINNLGSAEERQNFNASLKEYFSNYKNQLCDDCQSRLEKNALRILDCKIDSEKSFLKNSPKIHQFVQENQPYYDELKKQLRQLKINFEENPNLVRGLDYYSDIAFEFVKKFEEKNLTLIGGGRYENLLEEFSGPKKSGIGFAIGIERILECMKNKNIFQSSGSDDHFLYVCCLSSLQKTAFLVNSLRENEISTYFENKIQKVKDALAKAIKANYKYFLVIGEQELQNNLYKIKELNKKEEFEFAWDDLIIFFEDKKLK